ncbi:MAG TPA: hypothetical protein VFC56_12490 [Stellaceae bacterium]|nr:hypothetical protein [Stellaceae bacterium]
MARLRVLGLAAVVVWLGSTSGPALADGLARFEKTLKPQFPAGSLTYKSSKSLGDDGFVLEDVVVTPPPSDPAKGDKPQPISIKTVTVEALDFDALEKQQPPLFAKVKFDGVTTGSSAGGFDLKQMAGIDTLSADFGVNYKLDADDKTFTLKRMELNLNGLAKLETSMEVDGVSADAAAKPDAAMADASLKTAKLTYDDHSLLSKAIPIAAAMQGSDPKALITMAINFLDAARMGQGEDAQKVIDSLVAFVEDYQKPKGPLKIALNPPDKVSNADLSNAKSADEMVKLLGIEVSYAGARSSTPAELPAEVKDKDKK